jgi:hypothetical protein
VNERRDRDDDDDDNGKKRGIYNPIPRDYERRITPELKRILEFPDALAHYSNDGLAKIKQSYVEQGGMRSNTRYGWLRTKA